MIEKTFEEVFTYEALYRAHLRGRSAKRDKKPLVRFETCMLENVYRIYKRLHGGTFSFKGYNHFTVYEPKRREIQTLHYSDRVVQHVICDDVLSPYFTARAVTDNTVCQIGKGSHFALRRFCGMLSRFIKKHGAHGYFLKCDVLKYFPAIPHDRLKAVFCTEIRDARLKNLLGQIIDSYHTEASYLNANGYPAAAASGKTGRGIPIGNQTSQVFGMFYLDPVDRLVKEKMRVKAYARYMDDFILVHESKSFLENALAEITKLVEALGLKLNAKTQIFPLKNGVTFLGFRFRVTESGKIIKTVKKQTKKRLRRRARLLKKACLDGVIDGARVRRSLAAFHGHLKHAKSYKLEKELFKKLSALAYKNETIRKTKR